VATCRETVEGALRKLGKLGAGRSARTVDAEDAHESLKGFYFKIINDGTLGRLRDVVPTTDYTAGENERVLRNSEDVTTISLPELVADDWYGSPAEYGSRWVPPSASVSPNRPPMDLSVVVINDTITGYSRHWLYDGQRAQWVSIDDLALDDEAPLSRRDPQGLQARIAVQIADEYGMDVPPTTLALASALQSSLANRWSMPRRPMQGVFM
jgi:hypothetical protein